MSTRRGKKMGAFHVRTPAMIVDVEYRFDSKAGAFFADYSDESFEHATRDELCKLVTACVLARTQIDYVPMIRIQLPGEYRGSYYRSEAAEISLRLSLVMLSKQSFKQHDHTYRLTQEAHIVDGAVQPTRTTATDGRRWATDDHPWDVLLPYTPERLEALKAIQDAIAKTRGRLLELIGDARLVDQVALNGAARIRLLGLETRDEKAEGAK